MRFPGLKTLCLLFLFATPAIAAEGTAITNLLGQASDAALDQLSRPGAFSADDAIRIALPGGKTVSKALKAGNKLGLTQDLTESLNRAAESAAGAAKPIMRKAINNMTLKDGVDVLTGGKTAGTEYLQKTAGEDVTAQMRPLVANALTEQGVLGGKTNLKKYGLNDETILDHVTKGATNGIFKYMGQEEAKLRANPLGAAKSILKGIHKSD